MQIFENNSNSEIRRRFIKYSRKSYRIKNNIEYSADEVERTYIKDVKEIREECCIPNFTRHIAEKWYNNIVTH